MAVRILSVAASIAFFLPLTAAFADPGMAVTMKFAIVIVLAGSALLPAAGLIAVMIVVPFAAFIQVFIGGQPAASEISDAAVLAFVAGASLRLVRQWTERPGRLSGPALVMGAVVVASLVGELAAMQATAPRAPILGDAWRHVTVDYWASPRELPVVHHAWRWAAWLALAVYAERIVGMVRAPVFVFRAWMAIGVAGALVSVTHLTRLVLASDLPVIGALAEAVTVVRFTALHPDLNAAGSYFALFLVPAIVVGVRRRAWWLWGLAAPVLGLAFFFARSRAAIVAVMVVVGAACLRHLIQWSPRARRLATPLAGVVVVGVLTLAALAATYVVTSRSNVAPSTAVEVRVQMARVAFEAVRRHPVFGVGLGDYIPATRRFVTPEMQLLRGFAPRGDNAHNNFLQIAVELGIPALCVFLWLVGPTALEGVARGGAQLTTEARGMSLGIAAFLLSAVLGHPLLIPQVGTAFFVAIGLAAGLGPARHLSRGHMKAVAAGVTFYLASAAWRFL